MSRRHPYRPTPQLVRNAEALSKHLADGWDDLEVHEQERVIRAILTCSYLLPALAGVAPAAGGEGGAASVPPGA